MQAAPLLAHIHQMLPLNTAEEEALRQSITLKKLRRKQYLLQEGDICKHYNFVLTGCLRMYYVDEKGIAHILQFATENWWVSDIGSFHSETPSQLYIDALEPSVVLQIKKQDLLHLYSHYPKFDRYFRVLVENAFVKMQTRVLQTISSTAEERYLRFLNSYPALANRVSQVQIASYIGVTPEFLSKIRKNIARH